MQAYRALATWRVWSPKIGFIRQALRARSRDTSLVLVTREWAILRRLSDIRYDATDTEVQDVIEKSLDKGPKRKEDVTRAQVLTTRREALALYREIQRITALFEWTDPQGRPWRDVLRASAREEFEAARFERDPELVNRLLVVGRDAVHRVAEQFVAKRQEVIEKEAGPHGAVHPPPFGHPPP